VLNQQLQLAEQQHLQLQPKKIKDTLCVFKGHLMDILKQQQLE
jgi:hypothetical protein